MSFDGLFTRGMVQELKEIESSRITKIYQPSKQEILFHLRGHGKNIKLIISTHPTYARIHLTSFTYESPATPPMFCMLLRKHLEGGIIESIEQVDLERIIKIQIRSRNEIGDTIFRTLYVEIMGRHSNLILTNEDNLILDSIKHLSPNTNSYRTVLPGFTYVSPPPQHKKNPFSIETKEDLIVHLDFLQGKLDKQLISQFSGLSPILAKEILYLAKLPTEDNLFTAYKEVINKVQNHVYEPAIMKNEGKETFYLFPLQNQGSVLEIHTFLSDILDRFYFGKAQRDRVKQKEHDLERFITNELQKNKNKLGKLESTLLSAENADIYQKYGELLTANLYSLKRGDKEANVVDYYDEDGKYITIPMDMRKTPVQNAQSYYQKYQKAKNSVSIVQEQIQITKDEILYFDSLLQQIQTATIKDIEEIREELEEGGYIRKRLKKQQKKKTSKPILEEYITEDGTLILVGKNNIQNDYLTNKLANRDDTWLHVKDMPGSHVVIRSTSPSEQAIRKAATIAAYFSKAKNSSSVPVDYTKIRYVKKPSGSKPGFVIYDNQQTVYVTPDEGLILKLKK